MTRTELYENFTGTTGKSLTQMKRYLHELGETYPYRNDVLTKLLKLSEIKDEEKHNASYVMTDEVKAKISTSRKGQPAWNKNMKMSEEFCTKCGHPHTEEAKKKIKVARSKQDMSYMHTEKYRKACSSAHTKALKDGKYKNRYVVDGLPFDSSWEVMFYLFNREAGNKIERQVPIELDNGKHYICDFKINDKLYEIKSPHFFDDEGHLYNPYSKEREAEKEAAIIKYNVTVISDIEPYQKWCDEYFCPDFANLFKVNLPFPDDRPIFHCNRKGKKSPYDAFYDMEMRQAAIENRLLWGPFGKNEKDNWKDGIFTPRHDRITPKDIVASFSITLKAPKVSELQENKVILPDDCKSVVNPFCGFGAVIRKCKELGIDVTAYDIQNVCNEDIIIQDLSDENFIDEKEYDCLFCCPPYADKEEWTVKMPVIKTCDEWIDLCLEKFPNCKEYIFIVDESKKYEYADDIVNRSHFGKNKEHYIKIKKV